MWLFLKCRFTLLGWISLYASFLTASQAFGISSILGSPPQSRIHFYCFMHWPFQAVNAGNPQPWVWTQQLFLAMEEEPITFILLHPSWLLSQRHMFHVIILNCLLEVELDSPWLSFYKLPSVASFSEQNSYFSLFKLQDYLGKGLTMRAPLPLFHFFLSISAQTSAPKLNSQVSFFSSNYTFCNSFCPIYLFSLWTF